MQSEQQGAGCGAHTGGTEQGQYSAGKRPSLLLIVDTDILGREEAIGKVLIKGFFETMKVHKQLPHMI